MTTQDHPKSGRKERGKEKGNNDRPKHRSSPRIFITDEGKELPYYFMSHNYERSILWCEAIIKHYSDYAEDSLQHAEWLTRAARFRKMGTQHSRNEWFQGLDMHLDALVDPTLAKGIISTLSERILATADQFSEFCTTIKKSVRNADLKAHKLNKLDVKESEVQKRLSEEMDNICAAIKLYGKEQNVKAYVDEQIWLQQEQLRRERERLSKRRRPTEYRGQHHRRIRLDGNGLRATIDQDDDRRRRERSRSPPRDDDRANSPSPSHSRHHRSRSRGKNRSPSPRREQEDDEAGEKEKEPQSPKRSSSSPDKEDKENEKESEKDSEKETEKEAGASGEDGSEKEGEGEKEKEESDNEKEMDDE